MGSSQRLVFSADIVAVDSPAIMATASAAGTQCITPLSFEALIVTDYGTMGRSNGKILCMSNSLPVSPPILERARKIKLFLMDIDGTLTDGGVCLISLPGGGVAEMKVFNSQDGLGLKLAHTMGIKTGFITGRKSPAVSQRASEADVDFVYLGQEQKMPAFEDCMRRAQVSEAEVAYMGDDLPDMPLAKRAGLAVAVANAAPELKRICHYVTALGGGEGSAREVVELILKAQGRWEDAIPQALA
jgi:3-deoxy-D-manno-octulosonate 8-phosphate phosphatase (KDO 8-P phosphatase)